MKIKYIRYLIEKYENIRLEEPMYNTQTELIINLLDGKNFVYIHKRGNNTYKKGSYYIFNEDDQSFDDLRVGSIKHLIFKDQINEILRDEESIT